MRDCVSEPATLRTSLLPMETQNLVLDVDGRRLLHAIDLRLIAGQITTIMGPNGAGKSLLLRILHGLIAPTRGSVSWAGKPPTEAVRKRQALVFQRPVLLRRSVAANVDFVLRLRGKPDPVRRQALLEHVGLDRQARQHAWRLSGGEQQRLALARALAIAPDVMLLDEPTASLDPASTQTIEDIVQRAHAGGTKIIFVTHDIGQARRLSDEIVFLHNGRVSEVTPAQRFFDEPTSAAAQDYLAGRIVL